MWDGAEMCVCAGICVSAEWPLRGRLLGDWDGVVDRFRNKRFILLKED